MVATALAEQPLDPVGHLGVDDTSLSKGHNYLTVLSDFDQRKVVGVGVGKDGMAIQEALIDMEIRGACTEEVDVITIDMSPAYISEVTEQMPDTAIVFDRFHMQQGLNKVVDQTHREESRLYKAMKNTRYLWLKYENNLTDKQRLQVAELAESYRTIGTVYMPKQQSKEVLDDADHSSDLGSLKAWIKLAWDSGIERL